MAKKNEPDLNVLFSGFAKIEPNADMRLFATALSQMTSALSDEGFSREESIHISLQMVLNNP